MKTKKRCSLTISNLGYGSQANAVIFLHEVITWDHISGAVPAALCQEPGSEWDAGWYLAVTGSPRERAAQMAWNLREAAGAWNQLCKSGTSTLQREQHRIFLKFQQKARLGRNVRAGGSQEAAFDGLWEHRAGETNAKPKWEGSLGAKLFLEQLEKRDARAHPEGETSSWLDRRMETYGEERKSSFWPKKNSSKRLQRTAQKWSLYWSWFLRRCHLMLRRPTKSFTK